jgi:hypothetical protein
LSSEHDELLEEEAKRKGISVNSLLTKLITKYAEWDRFAERFGYVSITKQGFRRMFELMTNDELVTHGKEMGSRNAPDVVRFWFGKLNLATFLAFLDLFSKYSGTFHYEFKTVGKSNVITFHHEFGHPYSVVLSYYFDEAIRRIVGSAPKIETGTNSVVVTFEEPTP